MDELEFLSVDLINLSTDGTQLLLKVLPLSSTVTKESIVYLLQHRSLPRFKLNLEGVQEAVNKFAIIQDTPLEDIQEFESIAIADKQDATLNVVVSDDKMTAYAEITNPYGGKHITLADIKARCDELYLKFGLLPKAMLALLSTCHKSASGKSFRVNIAKGIPTVDGIDATFKKCVTTDNHRKPKPKLLENGKVDMHDLGKNITVDAGTLLMTKTPATQGTPGKTITAEIVEQKAGIDHEFAIGKNVQVDPNNPLHLIASTHGIPIDEEEFIRVDDVLVLNQVDVKTGNVDYNGSIVITGDIQEGMVVKVTGDVTVMGLIESANITCGGDLTVKMPIIGHQKENESEFSCIIDCKGNLEGTIAQYSRLTVGKNLIMTNQLIHCVTDCKGSVMVHNETFSKGAIVGGTTSANGSVLTTMVGTSAGNKTMINLLGDYKNLAAAKKKYTHELQQTHDALNKTKQAESRADSLLDKEKKKQLKAKLAAEKQHYRDQSDDIQNRLFDLKLKISHYFATTHLTATKTLFSDANVCIANQNWANTKQLGPTVVTMKDNNIELTPYTKK
ncbi:DUF342 domain-containing protein [Psychromonas algicola]|uniref:DUF342 domain-containing protein n=1 Tax=Psychromonas algicola TaxID=2555642 RepID=UPI0010678022|nr:FapA family protein [Psychromonas sp. RZ5]TEW52959.1 DUF342 domain-containing protein [Psychromonas sp. RZ5]